MTAPIMINNTVSRTCVTVQSLDGGQQITDLSQLKIVIRPRGQIPLDKCEPTSLCDPCPTGGSAGGNNTSWLEYPAHNFSDDRTQVCFHWDALLWAKPVGRYMATVYLCNNSIGCFQMQVGKRFVARAAENVMFNLKTVKAAICSTLVELCTPTTSGALSPPPPPAPAPGNVDLYILPVSSSNQPRTTPLVLSFTGGNYGGVTCLGAVVTPPLNVVANVPGTLWALTYAGGASGPSTGALSGFTIPTLPVGGTFTAALTAQGDLSTGPKTYTMSIAAPVSYTDTDPTNNSRGRLVVWSLAPADLSLVFITADQSRVQGSEINIQFSGANNGASTVYDVGVTTPFAAIPVDVGGGWQVTYFGGASGAAFMSPSGFIVPVMPAGSSFTAQMLCQGSATVGAVNYVAGIAPPILLYAEYPTGDNSDTLVITWTAAVVSVNLAVTSSASSYLVDPSASWTHTVVAQNNGPAACNLAVLRMANAVGVGGALWQLTYAAGAAGPATLSVVAMAAGWAIPTFPSGGSVTAVLLSQAPPEVTTVSYVAAITTPAGFVDSAPANNTSAVSVQFWSAGGDGGGGEGYVPDGGT